jgi:hypothetical protein
MHCAILPKRLKPLANTDVFTGLIDLLVDLRETRSIINLIKKIIIKPARIYRLG